jgi:hypothetical protein
VYAVGIRNSRKRSPVRSATGFAAVVVALPLLVAEDAAAAGVWWLALSLRKTGRIAATGSQQQHTRKGGERRTKTHLPRVSACTRCRGHPSHERVRRSSAQDCASRRRWRQ